MQNKNIIFLNGKYIPLRKAKISVLDRGFLFADGVYEVVPVYNGKPFGFEEHIKRLGQSLTAIRLDDPLGIEQWREVFTKILRTNKAEKGVCSIYLQITRGASEIRKHAFPENITSTVLAMLSSGKNLPYETLVKGKSAITAKDNRWENCYIKSIALLPNILFSQQAEEAGCAETILIRDGYVMEGASSNVFIVKNSIIKTPQLNKNILAGVTRDVVLRLAEKNNMPCEETNITESEMRTADELWITSSTREIYPIILLDSKPIGTGRVGAVWEKMFKLYYDASRS